MAADLHWSCRPLHIPANLTEPVQNFTDRRYTLRTIMPNNPERLVFVDGHAVAFHSWFTSDQNSVIPGFIDMLIGVVNRHEPAGLVVAFDPPPPTFRHELYPGYKSNRPKPPEEFLDECDELEQLLRSNNVMVCKVAGFEADDVLGTLSDKASKAGMNSLIYTCDLDLLQVLDENTEVEVFSQYRETRTFDVASATRRFNGIGPLNIPDLKALMGDRSDNLPGVPGIGEKSATTILLETRDIETLYADLERVTRLPIRGSKRIFRILSEHKDDAFLMKRLATILRDVPIDIDIFGADVRSFDLDAIVTV